MALRHISGIEFEESVDVSWDCSDPQKRRHVLEIIFPDTYYGAQQTPMAKVLEAKLKFLAGQDLTSTEIHNLPLIDLVSQLRLSFHDIHRGLWSMQDLVNDGAKT